MNQERASSLITNDQWSGEDLVERSAAQFAAPAAGRTNGRPRQPGAEVATTVVPKAGLPPWLRNRHVRSARLVDEAQPQLRERAGRRRNTQCWARRTSTGGRDTAAAPSRPGPARRCMGAQLRVGHACRRPSSPAALVEARSPGSSARWMTASVRRWGPHRDDTVDVEVAGLDRRLSATTIGAFVYGALRSLPGRGPSHWRGNRTGAPIAGQRRGGQPEQQPVLVNNFPTRLEVGLEGFDLVRRRGRLALLGHLVAKDDAWGLYDYPGADAARDQREQCSAFWWSPLSPVHDWRAHGGEGCREAPWLCRSLRCAPARRASARTAVCSTQAPPTPVPQRRIGVGFHPGDERQQRPCRRTTPRTPRGRDRCVRSGGHRDGGGTRRSRRRSELRVVDHVRTEHTHLPRPATDRGADLQRLAVTSGAFAVSRSVRPAPAAPRHGAELARAPRRPWSAPRTLMTRCFFCRGSRRT